MLLSVELRRLLFTEWMEEFVFLQMLFKNKVGQRPNNIYFYSFDFKIFLQNNN